MSNWLYPPPLLHRRKTLLGALYKSLQSLSRNYHELGKLIEKRIIIISICMKHRR